MLRPAIIEMMRMVGSNSVMAYIKLLKILITDAVMDFVLMRAISIIPRMHTSEQSLFFIIVPSIMIIKRR